ncbi:hypothetical protein ACFXDJ_15255 [Streptomyces sp. NPDC059443]|uniref:hypothetical protein n=1 Tax=unclassified Streptomyces TaxID=2593676 RepID=UPI0036C84734
MALSLLAGAVVLAWGWRSGALERRRPRRPLWTAYGVRRTAPRGLALGGEADQERSVRLSKAIDEAADDGLGQGGDLTEFERIVLYAFDIEDSRVQCAVLGRLGWLSMGTARLE